MEENKEDPKEFYNNLFLAFGENELQVAKDTVRSFGFYETSEVTKEMIACLLADEKISYSDFYRVYKKKAFINGIISLLQSVDEDKNAGIVGYSMFLTVGKLNASDQFDTLVMQDYIKELEGIFISEEGFFAQGVAAQLRFLAESVAEEQKQDKTEVN